MNFNFLACIQLQIISELISTNTFFISEQIKMLTGHTARPDFLKKITWLALNHHAEVKLIDTVRAFHFGNNFLVEVDIVLEETMNLRKAHDIGESLQVRTGCTGCRVKPALRGRSFCVVNMATNGRWP